MARRHRRLIYGEMQPEEPVRIEHDASLVEVVEHCPRVNDCRFNLVTPFAGKEYCFDDYLRGLWRLPLDSAHAIFYDNSNCPEFGRRLSSILPKLFWSWTLLRDHNKHYTIESSQDYGKIDQRVWSIYDLVFKKHLLDLPVTMVVEDDVEVPEDTYDQMLHHLDTIPDVGTVVASMNSRRLNDGVGDEPVAWYLERTYQIGGNEKPESEMIRIHEEKPFGVEIIGSAHTGCWMSKTEAIRKVKLKFGDEGLTHVDQAWGLNLHHAGYHMVIDWSIKTKHYFQEEGEKEFV